MHYLQCDNAAFVHNLYHQASPGMTPERFRAITSRYAQPPDRGRRRLLPRPLPGDRPRAGARPRSRPACPSTTSRASAPSRAARARSSTTSPPSASAGSSRSASAATTARVTSCSGSSAPRPGVELDHFVTSPERRTFTYCKPLVVEPGREPVELNRLDSKNWTPTPAALVQRLAEGLREIAPAMDAMIVLEQVDRAETGVVTRGLLDAIAELAAAAPRPADPRRLAARPGRLAGPELQDERGRAGGDPETRGRRIARPGDGQEGGLGPGPAQWPAGLRDPGRAGDRRGRGRRPGRARPGPSASRPDRHRRRRRRRHGEPGRRPVVRSLARARPSSWPPSPRPSSSISSAQPARHALPISPRWSTGPFE